MSDYIHGATDPVEIDRLERQAKFAAPRLLAGLPDPGDGRILDLATGVGAMAAELHARFPRSTIIGVDRSAEQLDAARKHPWLSLVRADGTALPFPDASFRLVHASWLLEHVPDPEAILRECRRVAEPGGLVQFTEVENASLLFHPSRPEAERAFDALNVAQLRLGGDPFIGRKLDGLMRRAGFSKVEVKPQTMHGNAGDPVFFHDFAEEFWRILESAREALAGAVDVDRAVEELQQLPAIEGASMTYTAFVGRAIR